MKPRYINPLDDFGSLLLNVEKPARYAGGEYGRLCGRSPECVNKPLKTLIAFPDLYEIGMSNQAFRIIYNRLNGMEDILCDRAFAPAPDFEKLLRSRGIGLYGLDTGIHLADTDILMFTFGYELGITCVLSMLDISGIPLHAASRRKNDPIVIMGGPCVSNPLPYSSFIDAFWIGEAEGGFFELAAKLAEIKKSGGGRDTLLDTLVSHRSVWTKKKEKAFRAIDIDFSEGKGSPAIFPVSSMKVVHQHGAVEIMRGCPNGCRFCHAGYWYRPMRQKNANRVAAESEEFIKVGGYREISLSSLSSGDYRYLESLIDSLNDKFSGKKISFQLPSLKVSTFSLKLLDKISKVRKSGLTFAVETPAEFWQMAINKEVFENDIVSILLEAKRHGWSAAKFYFMIGLPLETQNNTKNGVTPLKSEEEEIAVFVERVTKQTRMRFNINIGTFVPKPHTPFQWAAQISREASEGKLKFLQARLKRQGHKVGTQDSLISIIEGIASRGDERAGGFFEEAYKAGCRLDSWNEYIKREIWESLIEKYADLIQEIMRKKELTERLPWNNIESGVGVNYFKKEEEKSILGETTSPCTDNCNNPCGICGQSTKIVQNIIQREVNCDNAPSSLSANNLERSDCRKADPDTNRIIFSFSKQESAVFHSHLGMIEIFFMAFFRGNIPLAYSKGFNPLPKLDIASPLSIGVMAEGEIASIDTETYLEAKDFMTIMNSVLPEGIIVNDAINVFIPSGAKKHSVSALLWGFVYSGHENSADLIKAGEEKTYRNSRLNAEGNLYGLKRLSVLAAFPGKAKQDLEGKPYFTVYRELYPSKN